jgi:hypothetical protein
VRSLFNQPLMPEHRTVAKALAQLGETLLPLLLALLFGCADLGAAVSGSRRRGFAADGRGIGSAK